MVRFINSMQSMQRKEILTPTPVHELNQFNSYMNYTHLKKSRERKPQLSAIISVSGNKCKLQSTKERKHGTRDPSLHVDVRAHVCMHVHTDAP